MVIQKYAHINNLSPYQFRLFPSYKNKYYKAINYIFILLSFEYIGTAFH